MKNYGLNELREMYLSFFETKGHLRLPSFSLIPKNDPSLLLINAGMSPMKTWFTGEEEPPRRRVTTCQKCIRTPDIENIGKTARHGTYFEMLGNFSFGDYFKHEAIRWAWEFLTSPEWVGLDPDRLYPSVFSGNETTPADDEAFDIWNKEIGIPADRIYRFGKEDNFWEHGSGPCGPCSEIYYDRGAEYGCGKSDCHVGCDCDRFMEVWNIVFSQFNNDGQGNYTELSQKNIDTGMGLERLAVVCQNVNSLFEVDTVMNITHKVSEITGAHYGETYDKDVSLRIITDHIRSSTFMTCDGVLPSNEGRGYVLRRLLRRAARHGRLLGVKEPFLYKVCDTVIQENRSAYPELSERQEYITSVIRAEEENFARTIDGGLSIFSGMLAAHRAAGEDVFSGADAFKLYDTYGFPLDLTKEMATEAGLGVDEPGFQALMREQRERARAARAADETAWAGLDLGLDNTPTAFTGYDLLHDDGKILAIVAENELRERVGAGVEASIVLDKTPFYAEMGGQSADFGLLILKDAVFEVRDVQKNKAGKVLHTGVMVSGNLAVGDTVNACVDTVRRKAIMRAHSATHLLHKALRSVLGDHVHQAGSLVEPDRLRFDFTHFSAMKPEEIASVERMVNEAVLEGFAVDVKELPIAEAKSLGAMALFGEKYGDVVRVVDMGDGYSVEFCGGTHLDNTAKIGAFRIMSEFSVASGVRRIEAVTGKETLRVMEDTNRLILSLAERIKAKPEELLARAEARSGELRILRQTVEKFRAREMLQSAEGFLASAKTVGGFRVLTTTLPDATPDDMRQIGDVLRDRDPNVVAVLAAVRGGKITFLAVCGKAAVAAGIKAGDIIRSVCAVCGGKGGGKPDSAMGGGADVLKLDDALATVDDLVASKLN
ncbi:MAG: alanine--tRNA ligase [Oscillospiraceae bacterium]|nr:alanine--tRNA ligase [Oscillospiraceae bacterium]